MKTFAILLIITGLSISTVRNYLKIEKIAKKVYIQGFNSGSEVGAYAVDSLNLEGLQFRLHIKQKLDLGLVEEFPQLLD